MKCRVFVTSLAAGALAIGAAAIASGSTGSSIKVTDVHPNSPGVTYYDVKVTSSQKKCRVSRDVQFYSHHQGSGFRLDSVIRTNDRGTAEGGVYAASTEPAKFIAVKKRYRSSNGKRKTCSKTTKKFTPENE